LDTCLFEIIFPYDDSAANPVPLLEGVHHELKHHVGFHRSGRSRPQKVVQFVSYAAILLSFSV
jgi:hypothetical protein